MSIKAASQILASVVAFAAAAPVAAKAEVGIAAWYAGKGGTMVAAHKTLPMGSHVTVTNLRNGRHVVVRITDRGPFTKGRIIDLSRDAARALSIDGIARVSVETASVNP